MPFLHSDLPEGDDRNAFELTNIEAGAGLSVRVVDWASLDYKLAILRQPQLIDQTQVTNTLLLTLGVAVGSKAPAPPPPPPPCEPAAAPATGTEPATAPATAPAPAPAPAAPPPAGQPQPPPGQL